MERNTPFNIPPELFEMLEKSGLFSQINMAPNMPPFRTPQSSLNSVLSMLMGGMNFAVPAQPGQSLYESYQQRDRSRQQIDLMKNMFAGSNVVQKLGGLDTKTLVGNLTSTMFGRPDGLMDHPLMRAFNGGNPVKAALGLSASMTGMTMGMLTGNVRSADTGEVARMMRESMEALYHTKTITQKDYDDEVATRNTRGLKDGDEEYLKDLKTRIGEKTFDRLDTRQSRGFELQELTRASSMAADFGMFSFNDKNIHKGFKAIMGEKGKGGIGAPLRAISDAFGTEDAGEAMEIMNSLLGNSKANLGDEGVSEKMTDLFRRFKTAANAAGVSIKAISGILSETKALSARHPELYYQGGASMLETSIHALTSASALSSTMGADWVRQKGGSKEIQRQVTSSEVAEKAQPSFLMIGATVSQIDQSGLPEFEKEKLYKEIEAWQKDPNNKFTSNDFNRINDTVAKGLHTNAAEVTLNQTSMSGQQSGVITLQKDEFKNRFGTQETANDLLGQHLVSQLQVVAGGNVPHMTNEAGEEITREERVKLYLNELAHTKGKADPQLIQKYFGGERGIDEILGMDKVGQDNQISLRKYAMRQDPNSVYNLKTAEQTAIIKSSAAAAEEMSKKSPLQGKFLHTLAGLALSGSFEDGIKQFKDVVSTPELQRQGEAILRSSQAVYRDKTPEAFTDIFMQARGGAEKDTDENVIKALQARDLKPEQIKEIMDQRAVMKGTAMKDLTEFSEKNDITANQILASAKNYDNSVAKSKGIDETDIKKQAGIIEKSKMFSTDVLEKWGDSRIGGMIKNAGMTIGVGATRDIAYGENKKIIDSQFSTNVKDLLKEYGTTHEGEAGKGDAKRQLVLKDLETAWVAMGITPVGKDGKADMSKTNYEELMKIMGHEGPSVVTTSALAAKGYKPGKGQIGTLTEEQYSKLEASLKDGSAPKEITDALLTERTYDGKELGTRKGDKTEWDYVRTRKFFTVDRLKAGLGGEDDLVKNLQESAKQNYDQWKGNEAANKDAKTMELSTESIARLVNELGIDGFKGIGPAILSLVAALQKVL